MRQAGISKEGVNPVISSWVSPDGHYAFVEMRSIEEANGALNFLNGIQVGAFNLKIGRPKGYTGPAPVSTSQVLSLGLAGALPLGPLTNVPMLGGASSLVTNPLLSTSAANPLLGLGLGISSEPLSNVIMVSNLPALISEDQIKELFTPFGELKAFNLIKTPAGQAQSAVFEFVNPDVTDGVVSGMNKLDIAGNKLSVQRVPLSSAAVLLKPTSNSNSSPKAVQGVNGSPPENSDEIENELKDIVSSPVIRLSNMTTDEDLTDDTLYEELIEDVAEECNRHGTVKNIIVPRKATQENDTSVGKIFVQFTNPIGAKQALTAIAGRKFNGKIVRAVYYPERLFTSKVYTVPKGYNEGEESIEELNRDLD